MNETLTVEVTTQVFGLGGGKPPAPTLIALTDRTLSVRALIAEHVRSEIRLARQRQTTSIALHYMLSDDVRAEAVEPTFDADYETKRAWEGLAGRRYVLVVDGVALDDLDAHVCLTEHSHVSFVRLLPLVGG